MSELYVMQDDGYQKKHSPTRAHEEDEEGFAQTTRSA